MCDPVVTERAFAGADPVRSPRRRSLILDRTERTVYVAARADARRFLAQQWPKAEPGTLTQEEWTAMVKRLQNSRQDIDIDEINRRIEEQYALVEALQEWLDRHLPN